MGAYLDRLNAQFDEITDGIDEILNRAADEGREVTEEEDTQVKRDQGRAEELKKAIDHYAGIEKTRGEVEVTRSRVPAKAAAPRRDRVKVEEPEAKLEDLFPSVGHYLQTVHRATQEHDKDAVALLERAETAHQVLASNPGLVPRPIIQPLIDLIDGARPFLDAIGSRPLVGPSFDRPIISQRVAVAKQEREKALTASREMKIDKLPVQASTYAGHLNISRQDVKWTSPGILTIVAQDFTTQYAIESDEDAVYQFEQSIAGIAPVQVALEVAAIRGAFFAAAAAAMQGRARRAVPDTAFMSTDVWAALGGMTNELTGLPAFPGLDPLATSGEILGLAAVTDPGFDAGTFTLGRASLLEWYEDVDGLISIDEPDVLGQLVGYAGYGAFLNVAPDKFVRLELPSGEVTDAAAAATTTTTKSTATK